MEDAQANFFYRILCVYFDFFGCAGSLLLPGSLVSLSGVCCPAVTHWLLFAGAALAAEHRLEGAWASALQGSGSAVVAPGL